MTDMNERQQNALNWLGRVLTWIIPVGVIIYQAGAQGQQINGIEKRVTNLEILSQASANNSYRLSRLDASVDNISKKSADDHDTLVRIDQTVSANTEILTEMRKDIKGLSREN